MFDISYKFSVLNRFLKYVTIDTQSSTETEIVPSTKKQLILIKELKKELIELELEDVNVSEYGILTATMPGNVKDETPVIGLLAHVDTSPDVTGKNVKPTIHKNYDGGDIKLPADPSQIILVDQNPELKDMVGEDIVTSDGTTLLGSDDKSGVAEIMDAIKYLAEHPDVKRPTLKIAFTVDEETGLGVRKFDVKKFGADYAYTLDGGKRGEIETESFCADAMELKFNGHNVHPGYAKGKLINAIKVAAFFINLLPKDTLSPETTEKREGYVHCNGISGLEEQVVLKIRIRDFSETELHKHEELLEQLAQQAVEKFPGSSYEVTIDETYRNMHVVLEKYPKIKEYAEEAMKKVGLQIESNPIRGGTDGSQLCFMGLPTANLFAGEHNFHSKQEFTSVQEMEDAVKVIIELVQLWAIKSS